MSDLGDDSTAPLSDRKPSLDSSLDDSLAPSLEDLAPDPEDHFGDEPDAWPDFHICDDFLDPLAEVAVDWDARSSNVVADLRTLESKLNLREVSGRVVFWDLARAWLDAYVSMQYREVLEREIDQLAAKCRALQQALSALNPGDAQWNSALVDFGLFAVGEFVESFRSRSAMLRRSPFVQWLKSSPTAEHLRRLRDLVASYDESKTLPAVADRGIGHILHTGHTCECLMVELLRDLFTWQDEHRLDEWDVSEKFEKLCAASEEADAPTGKEGKVLTLASGSVFSFLGRHWQNAHECLFHVARTMAEGFRGGAGPQESLENHFLRRTVEDWPKLFAQVQRERALAESGTEIRKAKGKPGRKRDPEIAERNEKAVGMFKEGKSVNEVCEALKIKPALARKIKSDAGLCRGNADEDQEP